MSCTPTDLGLIATAIDNAQHAEFDFRGLTHDDRKPCGRHKEGEHRLHGCGAPRRINRFSVSTPTFWSPWRSSARLTHKAACDHENDQSQAPGRRDLVNRASRSLVGSKTTLPFAGVRRTL
jgi:hypothetical protein